MNRKKDESTMADSDVETLPTNLAQFSFHIMDFIVSVLDSKTGNFRAHARSVARYVDQLSDQLGLPAEERQTYRYVAYLHDLDRLMHGQGKEVDVPELLKNLGAPEPLWKGVYHIGEWFDGQGVPEGLRGEAIPLGSRIVALANRYDEMTRGKSNTQVFDRHEADKALHAGAGSQFDPKLVELLLQPDLSSRSDSAFQQDPRLLVIAENDRLRYSVTDTLMRRSWVTKACSDPVDALQLLVEFSPHIVILTLPLFDYFVELLLESDRFVPIPALLLGQPGDEHDLVVSDHVIIEDIVHDPFDADDIGDRLQSILERILRDESKAREKANHFEENKNYSKAGNIYRELGEYRKAAAMFELAKDLQLAGNMYELLGDYHKAAQVFEQAGEYNKAADYYGKIELRDDQARMFEKTGDYYYTAKNKLYEGNTGEALKLFKQLDPSHERYNQAAYFVGKIYMEKQEWKPAIEWFEMIIEGEKIGRRNLRIFYNMAVAHERLKRYVSALEIYEKILGVDYNFRDVYKRVERVRDKLQQLEQQTKQKQHVTEFANRATENRKTVRYEKSRVIGRGGMGVVYRAKDKVLGREVALKVLSAAYREDKLVVSTFLREAKSAAMLNHVNIVTVYDAGIEENNYFIAMELIEGQTLKELIRNKQEFTITMVLRIMRQVCSGLVYAHSKKIIHRDLTNSNIMITKDNVVKIMDFGLARIVEHLMSEQSIIGGTPSYMSPEQVKGAPIDQRADIYSLGVNMFELLTGQTPFTKGDLGYHHVHTPPPDPKELNPKISNDLSTIILRCLEKRPENRFQSVSELATALKV